MTKCLSFVFFHFSCRNTPNLGYGHTTPETDFSNGVNEMKEHESAELRKCEFSKQTSFAVFPAVPQQANERVYDVFPQREKDSADAGNSVYTVASRKLQRDSTDKNAVYTNGDNALKLMEAQAGDDDAHDVYTLSRKQTKTSSAQLASQFGAPANTPVLESNEDVLEEVKLRDASADMPGKSNIDAPVSRSPIFGASEVYPPTEAKRFPISPNQAVANSGNHISQTGEEVR